MDVAQVEELDCLLEMRGVYDTADLGWFLIQLTSGGICGVSTGGLEPGIEMFQLFKLCASPHSPPTRIPQNRSEPNPSVFSFIQTNDG